MPSDWDVGGFDRKTGRWKAEKARNIKWVAQLGSQTWSTPAVADGRVYVGTNNGAGYLKRCPYKVDLGVLLCFRETDGGFLWQFSGEKLPTGLAHDWPMQGIFGSPHVEGDRMWFVSYRCEVVCLDTHGFYDGEDDGPVKDQWVRACVDHRYLHDCLDGAWPSIDEALRAFLVHSGCQLPKDAGVHTVADGKCWLLQAAGADLFEVRLEKEQLVVYDIKPPRADSARIRRAAAPNRLINHVSRSDVGKTLRALFASSGFELPPMILPRQDEASGAWSFAVRVGEVERQFRIREAGSRLRVETMLTAHDDREAEVVWRFDMIKELGVFPHNWSPLLANVLGRYPLHLHVERGRRIASHHSPSRGTQLSGARQAHGQSALDRQLARRPDSAHALVFARRRRARRRAANNLRGGRRLALQLSRRPLE